MKLSSFFALGLLALTLTTTGARVAKAQWVVANPMAPIAPIAGASVRLPAYRHQFYRRDYYPSYGVYLPYLNQPYVAAPYNYGYAPYVYPSFVSPYTVGYRYPGAY